VRRVVIEVHENLTAPFELVEQVVRDSQRFGRSLTPQSVGTLFAPDVS
jgi:hypothetical protein